LDEFKRCVDLSKVGKSALERYTGRVRRRSGTCVVTFRGRGRPTPPVFGGAAASQQRRHAAKNRINVSDVCFRWQVPRSYLVCSSGLGIDYGEGRGSDHFDRLP
jgi:hypothetical protein